MLKPYKMLLAAAFACNMAGVESAPLNQHILRENLLPAKTTLLCNCDIMASTGNTMPSRCQVPEPAVEYSYLIPARIFRGWTKGMAGVAAIELEMRSDPRLYHEMTRSAASVYRTAAALSPRGSERGRLFESCGMTFDSGSGELRISEPALAKVGRTFLYAIKQYGLAASAQDLAEYKRWCDLSDPDQQEKDRNSHTALWRGTWNPYVEPTPSFMTQKPVESIERQVIRNRLQAIFDSMTGE